MIKHCPECQVQDPTTQAASVASSDQADQVGLVEVALVVFLAQGAEVENDFFQDVFPTRLGDQEMEGSKLTCT